MNPVTNKDAYVTIVQTPTMECPVHGPTLEYITSTIWGYDGQWCVKCWLESLDRMGVHRLRPIAQGDVTKTNSNDA